MVGFIPLSAPHDGHGLASTTACAKMSPLIVGLSVGGDIVGEVLRADMELLLSPVEELSDMQL